MSPRERKPGSARTTRLRKAECLECGLIVRVSRKVIENGLPLCGTRGCACYGLELTCPEPADQIIADPELLSSLPRPLRTDVCRENGWDSEIIRTSPGRHGGLASTTSLAALPF